MLNLVILAGANDGKGKRWGKDGSLHKKQAIVEDLRMVLEELEDREWGRGVGGGLGMGGTKASFPDTRPEQSHGTQGLEESCTWFNALRSSS